MSDLIKIAQTIILYRMYNVLYRIIQCKEWYLCERCDICLREVIGLRDRMWDLCEGWKGFCSCDVHIREIFGGENDYHFASTLSIYRRSSIFPLIDITYSNEFAPSQHCSIILEHSYIAWIYLDTMAKHRDSYAKWGRY